MSNFKLKPTHAPVKAYYETLEKFGRGKFDNEGNIRRAFESLLEKCARPFDWFVVGEYQIARTGKSPLRVDAAMLDAFNLRTRAAEFILPEGAVFRYLSHRNSSQFSTNNCARQHNCSTWNNFGARDAAAQPREALAQTSSPAGQSPKIVPRGTISAIAKPLPGRPVLPRGTIWKRGTV